MQLFVSSFWFLIVPAIVGAIILQSARLLPEQRDAGARSARVGARVLIWLAVAWTIGAAAWVWIVTLRSAESTTLMDPLPGILASTIPVLIAALPLKPGTVHAFVRNCGRSALAMCAFSIMTVGSIGTFYAPCAVLLLLAGFNAVRSSRSPQLAVSGTSG